MYLNPGTNGSDKQDLTPLQAILKKTAESKDLAAEHSRKSARDKVEKKKQMGDLEKQFHMRGPSPYATSDDEIEISRVYEVSEAATVPEREFKKLSGKELDKLTPEENDAYWAHLTSSRQRMNWMKMMMLAALYYAPATPAQVSVVE